MGVEHDDHVVDAVGEALREAAARGDLDGPGDPVQPRAVPGDERRHTADPGHDVVRERHRTPLQDLLQDPERAVVQRGIAPHQERAALLLAQLLGDQPLVDVGTGAAPVPDRRRVRRTPGAPVAVRVTCLDQPVRPLGYVRVEDVTAQLDEVGLHLALVQDEEHVRVPQRLDRLKRELVGVTRPNPDDMNLSHTESLPHATDSGSTASGVSRGDGRVRLRVPAAAAPTSPR